MFVGGPIYRIAAPLGRGRSRPTRLGRARDMSGHRDADSVTEGAGASRVDAFNWGP